MNKPELIQFPKIHDERGNLTYVQNSGAVPFKIKRVFWTYDVPSGETRGGHAYRSQHEVIIALSGSFDVVVSRIGGGKIIFQLNRGYYGLYLPPLTWRHIENYSTNSLSLHLSSERYTPHDYIRSREDYEHAE